MYFKMSSRWSYFVMCCYLCVVPKGQGQQVEMGQEARSEVKGHAWRYCNTHEVTGVEGSDIPGYSLQSVHVVMTPGQTDTSTSQTIRGHNLPPISCNLHLPTRNTPQHLSHDFPSIVKQYHASPRSSPDLRHHQPTFPAKCSQGHLTEQGFTQISTIGDFLHSRYMSRRIHKRLKPHYSSVHVESLSMKAAYHSTLALLHKLLPHSQLMKTKIHKARSNFCDKSESNITSCTCDAVRELTPHVLQAVSLGKLMFKDSAHKSQNLQDVFGNISLSLENLSSLQVFKHLMLYNCNNISPSCNEDNSQCLVSNEDKLAVLYKMTAKYLHSLYRTPTFRTYTELKSYPFLQQLVSRATSPHVNQSMFVYMGDNSFLQYLRTSLTVLVEEVTPLGSRLVIEVFKSNPGHSDSGRLYFRVLYNGRDVTDRVGICQFHIENGLCSLATLEYMVDVYRGQYLDRCR